MENNYGYVQEAPEKKGSIIGGIIGALIGAAIGAAAWTLVGMAGYIASIIGFVIAFLADKGYDLLKGRQGVCKMIVLIICVVLAVAAGTLGTYVWSIHNEYNEQYLALSEYEKEYYVIATEAEFMKDVLSDSDVQSEMVKDSVLGLVFGIMGSIGLIRSAKNGKRKASPVKAETTEATGTNLEASAANSEEADEHLQA